MFSFRVFVVLSICIFVSSTYSSSPNNNAAKITLEKASTALNTRSASGRQSGGTDFDANPSTALLPVIPAIIALKTALILSVIAWGIFKLVSSKDDDDNETGYGQSPSSQYGVHSDSQYSPNRMDLSQYGSTYNFARNFGSSSTFGQLTNVVWKALEKYSASN